MSVQRPRWTERRLTRPFVEWSAGFGGDASRFSPVDYPDSDTGYPYVLCSAWLFCPRTVEYRDGVFLADRFEAENVDTWRDTLDGVLEPVEDVVDETHLFDVFTNTDFDPYGEEQLSQLAVAVAECRQGVLTNRYPGRGIIVEYRDEDDEAYGPAVTFWSTNPA